MTPGHAWVDVDLDAVVANARAFADRTGRPLLPMVKADAYGLGAIPVARALESVDPWGFGVATISEGEALRRAGIRRPILVFTPFVAAAHPAYRQHDLRPSIGDWEGFAAWWTHAADLAFHLEVDTGLSRTGVRWSEAPPRELRDALVASAASGRWEGVFTHLYAADAEDGSAELQRSRLRDWLSSAGAQPAHLHVASSAGGVMGIDPEETLVRPGIFLYGGVVAGRRGTTVVRLRAPVVGVHHLRPGDVVSYDATWQAVQATTVATIGAGYADGVPRSLSNRGRVELGDRVVPIVGTVAMDYIMVDVGEHPVRLGDTATIYGDQVGLDDQARLAGTISYELLTRIGPRVPRLYCGGSDGPADRS